MSITAVIQLLRPHQWVKNLLLAVPMVFAGRMLETDLLGQLMLAILSFCLLASTVYIINDWSDLELDRAHPTKRNRPLARGAVSIAAAKVLIAACLVAAGVSAYFIGYHFMLLSAGYLVLNLLYSFWLKHIPIVDITVIAVGFLIRIFAGGAVGDIPISHWLVLVTFLGALFLAIGKRRDDVRLQAETGVEVRKSASGYSLEFINGAMLLFAAVIVVAYIMYTISSEVVERVGSDYFYLSSLPIVIGVLRYIQLVMVRNRTGDPTELLIKDHGLKIIVAVWVAMVLTIMY